MTHALPTWFSILAATALPFWLSVLALAAHQFWEAPFRRANHLARSAGDWLRAVAPRKAPGVGVQMHDQSGMDAYWPGIDAIGLSRSTWAGRGPVQRAVAAHELGHAVNLQAHPWMPHVLPAARLVESWAWRGFGAALLVTALLGLHGAVVPAALFAVVATVAGLVVLADEGMASHRARQWLRADRTLSMDDVAIAERSMTHAWSVYGLRSAGQLAVLAWLPVLLPTAASLRDVVPYEGIEPVGAWILVVAVPFLALRLAQVLSQVTRPEPVDSDFRLFTVMQREAQWESLTGMAILAVLFALHDHGSGLAFAASAALAAIVALGPVSGVGRALVLLPVMFGLRRWTERSGEDDLALFGDAQPDGALPAMMALYSRPPWYLRASWVTNLAWVPMIALLIVELLSRGWWPV